MIIIGSCFLVMIAGLLAVLLLVIILRMRTNILNLEGQTPGIQLFSVLSSHIEMKYTRSHLQYSLLI